MDGEKQLMPENLLIQDRMKELRHFPQMEIICILQPVTDREDLGAVISIFQLSMKGNGLIPYNLGSPVNSSSWESTPSISADGNMLFFSSNRPVDLEEKISGIQL